MEKQVLDKSQELFEVKADGNGMYRCHTCNFETKYNQNLHAHFRTLKHISNIDNTDSSMKLKKSVVKDKGGKGDQNIRKSIGEGTYKCETCKFETKYSQNLQAHFTTLKHIANTEKPSKEKSEDISDDGPAADISKEVFKTSGPSILDENDILVCTSCNFEGKNRKSISVHWTWHPDCKKGDFTIKPAYDFDNKINDTNDEEESFFCGQCKKDLGNSRDYRAHQRIGCDNVKENCTLKKETNSKLKKEVNCSHCNKGFVTKDILTVHHIVAHSKPQIKLKRIDNLVSKYQQNVNRNLVSVHKQKKPWKCQLCPSSFPYKVQLKNHVKWVHDKTKIENCSICEATFARKGDLNKHYKKVHLDKGKSEFNFGPNATLKKRKEVKPYACNICDGRFTVPNQLKTHVEEAHEGKKKKLQKIVHEEKDHMCSICNAGFKSKSGLSEHKSIVHEGKKHGCSICGANLSGKSSHGLHIRSVGVVQVCAEHGL